MEPSKPSAPPQALCVPRLLFGVPVLLLYLSLCLRTPAAAQVEDAQPKGNLPVLRLFAQRAQGADRWGVSLFAARARDISDTSRFWEASVPPKSSSSPLAHGTSAVQARGRGCCSGPDPPGSVAIPSEPERGRDEGIRPRTHQACSSTPRAHRGTGGFQLQRQPASHRGADLHSPSASPELPEPSTSRLQLTAEAIKGAREVREKQNPARATPRVK